jgi:hypothetical protein
VKEKLRAALAAALARLRPALSFAVAQRFWLECAAVTLLGMLAAFSYGYAALGRAGALRERAAELERVAASYDQWRTRLQPASPQESAAWRASEQELRSLGGEAARPLAVARAVAKRAEEVGIGGLQVRLLATDSVAVLDSIALGAWVVQPAGQGLVVEFDGDVGDVVGFLGALPPQAVVTRLQITPQRDSFHARIILVTRQIAPRG